jgi:phage shock protein PspC (stress-responsive transcriptional regulator)
MKKTVTANIAGTVFHIEEDAFEQLQRYLGGIRANFSGSPGADEIMGDIESRIAELFTERLTGRSVVTSEDVAHIERVMGRPEDYAGEGAGAPAGGDTTPPPAGPRYRRLFRHPDDKWAGGVLGGIAAYFNTDPLWFRIAFILLIILGVGSPLLIYFILWILVPPADTPAERLMMEGEPVTVDNLKRAFEEGAERMGREADELGRRWSAKASGASGAARGTFVKLVAGVFNVLARIVGLFALFIGGLITLALVAALIGGGTISMDEAVGLEGMGLFELGSVLFDSAWQAYWSMICAVLLVLIPGIVLFIWGLRATFKLKAPRWLNWSLATVWLICLLVVMALGGKLGNDFRRNAELREEAPITQPTGPILYLGVQDMRGLGQDWNMSYDDGRVDWDMEGFMTTADSMHGAWAELDVTRSPDSLYHLVVERSAYGRSEKQALARASHIRGLHVQQDSLLMFSTWVDIPGKDKLRGQQVRFEVQVPVGGSVHLNDGTGIMLDDVDNVTNTGDLEMPGRTWTMTPRGLEDLQGRAPAEPREATPTDSTKRLIVAAVRGPGRGRPVARMSGRLHGNSGQEPRVELPNLFGALAKLVRV